MQDKKNSCECSGVFLDCLVDLNCPSILIDGFELLCRIQGCSADQVRGKQVENIATFECPAANARLFLARGVGAAARADSRQSAVYSRSYRNPAGFWLAQHVLKENLFVSLPRVAIAGRLRVVARNHRHLPSL